MWDTRFSQLFGHIDIRKKKCTGCIWWYHVIYMGVTFIYTQEKSVIFYMHNLLLYEARTKMSHFWQFFWQLSRYRVRTTVWRWITVNDKWTWKVHLIGIMKIWFARRILPVSRNKRTAMENVSTVEIIKLVARSRKYKQTC